MITRTYTDNRGKYQKWLKIAGAIILALFLIWIASGLFSGEKSNNQAAEPPKEQYSSVSEIDDTVASETENATERFDSHLRDDGEYEIISVVDGDTVKVNYSGRTTSVRLIGVNTPETVDPRKSVECFGQEASNYLKAKLSGKTVHLLADTTQSDRDKYDRLLRYVMLDDEDVNLQIIQDGYGYEYTYNTAYVRQSEYKTAQKAAEAAGRGLWEAGACEKPAETSSQSATNVTPSSAPAGTDCQIKGNISNKGEKIYHLPGQRYYNSTKIDTAAGERMFCTEQEAQSAGWRKSKV